MLAIWLHDSSSSSKVDLMIGTTPKGHYDHLACQLRRCRVLDVQGPYACRPPLGALSANEREREWQQQQQQQQRYVPPPTVQPGQPFQLPDLIAVINDAGLRHHWHLQTPLQPTDLLRYL